MMATFNDAFPIEIGIIRHGRWARGKDILGMYYRCSECRGTYHGVSEYNYCPYCGAKMDEDWEEPEINPCRGCIDYDGRGGCKSTGGCGAKRNEVKNND